MKHFRIPLLVIFLFSFVSSFAQEDCRIRGEIRDSLNLPVYDASISAFNSQDDGVGFTFSDTEGYFKLDLPCGDNYDLEIEHINYESVTENIFLDKSKTLKFTMAQAAITLEAAIIEVRQPITVKGDTIEYDADSFRTAADENLEDLLKRLPGLEVEDGKVFYEGKEITTIKVGNREVLGGNTKLLTKNLPADAIDVVQLNKKFKANPFANSLSDDEQAILNIELKEDKKSLIFGNITLGGDADEHYDIQSKLFYFSPKIDATSITDYNTYGKQVFDYQDYFTFLGGYSELMEQGGAFSLREEPNNLTLGTAQDAAEMDALIEAFHFGYEPNKKWLTNGFILLNNNNIKFKSTQERIGEDYIYRDENMNDQHLFSTTGRFRAEYNPNTRTEVKYTMTLNHLNNESSQIADTYLDDLSMGSRDISKDKNSFSLRNNLSYIKKVGRDDNIGFYLRHQWMDDKPDLGIFSENTPIIIDNINFLNLNQNKRYKSNKLQAFGIYNHLLTNTSNLRFKLGANFSKQNLDISIFEGNTLIDQSNFITDSDFSYTEFYGDLTYTKKWGIFKMDIGTGLHFFNEKTNTLTQKQKLDFAKFIPHFNAEFKLSGTQSLNLSYNQSYKLPNLIDLSNGYEVNNYYSIYAGFLGLRESLTHTANLSYGYFNSYNFLNFYMGANYYKNSGNIRSTSDLTNLPQQINSLENNTKEDESYNLYFGGGKRFSRYYSLQLNGNLNYMSYFTSITQLEFEDPVPVVVAKQTHNTSFSQNYTLTNKFKFRKKLEIDLGMNYSNSRFKSMSDSKFANYRPFGKFAWLISDKFLLQSDYSYRLQYQNDKKINDSQSLNASLRYHITKGVYMTVIGGNLLGTEKIVNSSFDATINQTTVNTREVLGRYFLVQLRFKF